MPSPLNKCFVLTNIINAHFYNLSNFNIERVNHVKDIDVIFDIKISFNFHVN